jgi:hypothetical protein
MPPADIAPMVELHVVFLSAVPCRFVHEHPGSQFAAAHARPSSKTMNPLTG